VPVNHRNNINMTDKGKIKLIEELNTRLDGKTAAEIIAFVASEFPGRVGLSTSLGLEDQVLTRLVSLHAPSMFIFTLDTGRLFPETYDLLDITSKRYKVTIETFFPDHTSVEKMVNEKGINLFYESVENRKLCCHIRKIEPLRRALANVDVWFSGLRREQSITRSEARLVDLDKKNGKIKINPLIDWSLEDVWQEIKAHNIPYNPLHDKGFPSIGCLPCTRAIEPGEDIRAGRWWWEHPEHKECGLHR
jgi:phosphoadenosine phosphosulfate reductase